MDPPHVWGINSYNRGDNLIHPMYERSCPLMRLNKRDMLSLRFLLLLLKSISSFYRDMTGSSPPPPPPPPWVLFPQQLYSIVTCSRAPARVYIDIDIDIQREIYIDVCLFV